MTKQEYFQGLREQWTAAKEYANIDAIQAILNNHGLNVSPISYAIVEKQMQDLDLEGLPYLDCKTFQGWKRSGFIVCKGQKSKISGIAWLKVEKENPAADEKESFMMPKEYKLFHKTQVKEI